MVAEIRRGVARRKAFDSLGMSGRRFCTDAMENCFDVTFGTDARTNVAVHKSNRFKNWDEGLRRCPKMAYKNHYKNLKSNYKEIRQLID